MLNFLLQNKGSVVPLRDTIVVANPGTGKTWEIVERVMQLLRSGVNGEDIVCVTFTNKAAEEMNSRIIKKASESAQILNQALRIEVSTIHSYAMNYLQDRGISVKMASNTVLRFIVYSKLLELKTFNYGRGYLVDEIVPKIENGIRYLKSFGILPDQIDLVTVLQHMSERTADSKPSSPSRNALEVLAKDFIKIFQSYEDFKHAEGIIDFNDLLRIFLEKMESGHKKVVLVDEFQDLNRMQVDIVGKLAEKRFFVGDRKQSIFGFQGGSLSSFNKYLNGSEFEKIGKTINHRSTNNILNYATSYFLAHSSDKYAREEIVGLNNPEKGEGEKVTLVPSSNPAEDSVEILKSIGKTNGEGSRKVAIIARSNSQINKISSLLDSLGISYSSTIRNKVKQSQIDEILTYISGLVSDDPATVSRALLTPFGGLTMMEAVSVSGHIKKNGIEPDRLPPNFRRLRESKFGLNLIEEAFDRVIFPTVASLSKGYVNSANLTLESAREYISTFPDYSMEGYLNYMALSSEQVESDLKVSAVNLLTVHKAKGLEFHTVIYVPSAVQEKLEYFDSLTSSIILSATGIDVKQDLLEEPLRVDFVALTRPEEKLYIMAHNKLLPRFELQNNFYEESNVNSEPGEYRFGKFDEAYQMFVNGRYDEAKEVLRAQDKWLFKTIGDYFSDVTKLSYSEISAVSEPYKFLRNYILGLRESSPFASHGTDFHEIAQKYANGSLVKEEIPEDITQDFRNLELALGRLSEEYIVPPKHSEMSIELPLSVVFPENGVPDNIIMKAKIDAVFMSRDKSAKLLIADYKTSRKTEHIYWHQLWLYTRMYQKKYETSPENISGGIIYVGLKESINTGELGYDVQVRDFYKIKTEVVQDRLREYLHYMDQPEAFMEKLVSTTPRSEIDSRLRDLLEKSL